ncbi:hypothetical protein G9P44_004196 [Scheffersomyces stipitis]|nr:hypothetical protein G9P44_004196 [Scheffersomyces stipitis]
MTDYYEPTLLFRQNALRRYCPSLSPISSVETLSSSILTNENIKGNVSSWMFNSANPKDTEVLNQSCSLNRMNIKSNYWKIPDTNMNLTAMAITDTHTDNPLFSVSSANNESNLFIYELDLLGNYLTHHNTISLPNINGMKWLPNSNRHLVTGNSKGYAHLVSIPEVNRTGNEDSEEQSAEICKRFNHRKHIKSKQDINKHSTISKLDFMNNDNSSLLSIYNNNLFYWDMNDAEAQRRPTPISISSISGLANFDPLPTHNANLVGICGKFGVSLFDLRQPKFTVPPSILEYASKKKLGANQMRWNPNNENVFAAAHRDGVVRLWDIRKQDNFANLSGHTDKISSLEWNDGDLFSGSRDGNIVHWDLTSDLSANNQFMNCGLKEGLDSVHFNPHMNRLERAINERQCGTVLPASNTNIISMCSVTGSDNSKDDMKVLSIDGSSFFGVHSKIFDAVNISMTSDKLYYTESDIQLMMKSENSNNTLVGSTDSINEQVTAPLAITRKSTLKDFAQAADAARPSNLSKDTLLGSVEDLKLAPEPIVVDDDDLKITKEIEVIDVDAEAGEAQEIIAEEDLEDYNDFTFAPPSFIPIQNGNVSTCSVDYSETSSRNAKEMFNDSTDTLTTDPTEHELDSEEDSGISSVESSPLKREASFKFQLLDSLDFEEKKLPRDDSFNTEMFNDLRMARQASVRTIGTHYRNVYNG